jgi:CRISPR/Cas system-associated exonuclease Cas4 (RecB family)
MGDLFLPRTLDDLSLTFPPELQHISATSLKMAVRCEEQWRQRYILGKKQAPNLNLIGGRADHKAIEESMVQKVESGVDLPVGVVRETFSRTLEEAVEEAGGLGELEFRDADTPQAKQKAYDELRQQGPQVAATYHTQVSPTLQPTTVEEKFTIDVPGVPVEVIGYTDLVAVDAVEASLFIQLDTVTLETGGGNPRIIDRKRSGRAKNKPEPEWLLQAAIYQLAVPLPHEWHISVTTKTPKIQLPSDNALLRVEVENKERTEKMLQMLVKKLGWLYQTFGPDDPWPTGGKLHPWACGFCGYRPDCWGWK